MATSGNKIRFAKVQLEIGTTAPSSSTVTLQMNLFVVSVSSQRFF